jgi:hypothetical protein
MASSPAWLSDGLQLTDRSQITSFHNSLTVPLREKTLTFTREVSKMQPIIIRSYFS